MKAREYAGEIVRNAKGKIVYEKDSDWTQDDSQKYEIDKARIIWHSVAPGSGAPTCLVAGAIQAVENMGKNVEKAEQYFEKGLKVYSNNDDFELMKISANIFYELNNAMINKDSNYWNYKTYESWEEFLSDAKFEKNFEIDSNKLKNQTYHGWIGQICAGSYGTAFEGYDRETIKNDFHNIEDYQKKPSTYNDDITFEIAFLLAYLEKKEKITSKDISDNWISLIPYGWSAEDIALSNIKLGIFPPKSGKFNNPYKEWIGAQMRGAVCGLVAPGDPQKAAYLAWIDGQISHFNNGIIGEVFNAIMTSLAFVETDVRKIIERAINMLPEKSQYYDVVRYALEKCKNEKDYETTLIDFEEKFKEYNLVHCYPNAAIEVAALWYGNGDYDKTLYLTALAGLDVDCNAAQIGTIVGIINSDKGIDKKWTDPIGTKIKTYVRCYEELEIKDLVEWTLR